MRCAPVGLVPCDHWRNRACRRRRTRDGCLTTFALSPVVHGADNPDVEAPQQSTPDSSDQLRASDADRDRALAELSDGFIQGRLSHDTFARRVEVALRARVTGELRSLVSDLPTRKRLGGVVTATYRRMLRATDRWLRGWPPVMTLPAGQQIRFTIG